MSPDESTEESSTDPNHPGFSNHAIEMSRDRFECFECGFAAEHRDEFDTQGLALSCPECRSLRVEHVFTSDDDDRDLVADGGLPTCEHCGETFLTETVAGPGEARRSCGCSFEPEFAVPDDTENAFANAAIRAMNATGDVETGARIYEGTRGRLVADGGTEYADPLEAVDGETEVEIECAVGIDEPEFCDGWSETVELKEPAEYDEETGRIFLPGFNWECPECGQPHEFEVDGTRVSNLV